MSVKPIVGRKGRLKGKTADPTVSKCDFRCPQCFFLTLACEKSYILEDCPAHNTVQNCTAIPLMVEAEIIKHISIINFPGAGFIKISEQEVVSAALTNFLN